LRADARVRVQWSLQICLRCRSKSWGVQRRNPALAWQKVWQYNLPILSVLCAALFYSSFLSIATFSSLLS